MEDILHPLAIRAAYLPKIPQNQLAFGPGLGLGVAGLAVSVQFWQYSIKLEASLAASTTQSTAFGLPSAELGRGLTELGLNSVALMAASVAAIIGSVGVCLMLVRNERICGEIGQLLSAGATIPIIIRYVSMMWLLRSYEARAGQAVFAVGWHEWCLV